MINVVYISIEGNTNHFVHLIRDYASKQHRQNAKQPLIHIKRITNQTDLFQISDPYFCFIPTYIEGGDTTMDIAMQTEKPKEIETLTMHELLGYRHNYRNCLGLVGSGNRNFNYLYCYTAKLYSSEYQIPLIDDYELRGTSADVKRIYQSLKQQTRRYQK